MSEVGHGESLAKRDATELKSRAWPKEVLPVSPLSDRQLIWRGVRALLVKFAAATLVLVPVGVFGVLGTTWALAVVLFCFGFPFLWALGLGLSAVITGAWLGVRRFEGPARDGSSLDARVCNRFDRLTKSSLVSRQARRECIRVLVLAALRQNDYGRAREVLARWPRRLWREWPHFDGSEPELRFAAWCFHTADEPLGVDFRVSSQLDDRRLVGSIRLGAMSHPDAGRRTVAVQRVTELMERLALGDIESASRVWRELSEAPCDPQTTWLVEVGQALMHRAAPEVAGPLTGLRDEFSLERLEKLGLSEALEGERSYREPAAPETSLQTLAPSEVRSAMSAAVDPAMERVRESLGREDAREWPIQWGLFGTAAVGGLSGAFISPWFGLIIPCAALGALWRAVQLKSIGMGAERGVLLRAPGTPGEVSWFRGWERELWRLRFDSFRVGPDMQVRFDYQRNRLAEHAVVAASLAEQAVQNQERDRAWGTVSWWWNLHRTDTEESEEVRLAGGSLARAAIFAGRSDLAAPWLQRCLDGYSRLYRRRALRPSLYAGSYVALALNAALAWASMGDWERSAAAFKRVRTFRWPIMSGGDKHLLLMVRHSVRAGTVLTVEVADALAREASGASDQERSWAVTMYARLIKRAQAALPSAA